MKIQSSAKYLGVFLGPKAGAKQWVAPTAKYEKRCKAINAEDAPMRMAVSRYSTHAVTVLGYMAQFIPPPRNIIRLELTGVLRAL